MAQETGFPIPIATSSRQVNESERQSLEKEALEDAMQTPLPDEIAEQIQDEHQANVNRQIAEAQVAARRSDAEREFLEAQQEADAANADQDGFVSGDLADAVDEQVSPNLVPSAGQERDIMSALAAPEFKLKLRRRYVRRGAIWRWAKDPGVKLKRGETVFVKAEGRYEAIGHIGADGSLPVAYLNE